MQQHKVCVYAICKNEQAFVDRWMDSMAEADLIIVTDTGSDDDTVAQLRNRGAIVYAHEIVPWRFDVARNISLDHVPDNVDICVCTDLDEVFVPGWREQLERAWSAYMPSHSGEVAKLGKYLYNWSLKADGTPDVQFIYSKVHGRHDFRWRCPVHEYVHYEGLKPLESVYIDGMVINHLPDPNKSRASYLPLLELAVQDAPASERMWYYLGREYMYKGQWAQCIDALTRYLGMPTATWNEERSAAMRWIAKACHALTRTQDAYRWYERAIAEAPHMRDPYVEFAKMCYELQDWPMTLFWAEEALKITQKSATFVNMGYAWDDTPDDLCAITAYRLNLLQKSAQHAKAALRHAPEDERLQNNVKLIEDALRVQGS